MSLYIHQTNSGLDFIITTEDEPESNSDSDYQRESQQSDEMKKENNFDVPIFSEKPELITEEEHTNQVLNSNEDRPHKPDNDTAGMKRQPTRPTKKSAMIKKKKEEPQECTVCARIFTTLRSLQRHTKSIHELQTVDCKECGKTFGGKDNLRVHIKAVHLKISYPCPNCGVRYKTLKSMKDHIRREHPLPSCLFHNLSFQTNEELQDHIQVEHLNKL